MKVKFKLPKIKEIFSKMVWWIGNNAFSIILLFVLLELILGGIIFYKYVYLAKLKKGEISGEVIKFNQENYEKIINKISPPQNTIEENVEAE